MTSLSKTWKSGARSAGCPISAYVSGAVTATSSASRVQARRGGKHAAPVNQVPPGIAGVTTQGQTLVTSTGSWLHSPTSYSYQWKDCDQSGSNCTSIAGETSSTHTLTSTDVGHTLRSVVTASNLTGSTSASSTPTALVSGLTIAPPANTAPPQISGTSTQGQTLTTATGSWAGNPTGYTYAWQDCDTAGATCTSIGGSSSNSYTLQASDVGHTIRAVVTASNAGGSTSATSMPTAVVAGLPAGAPGAGLPSGVTLQAVDGGSCTSSKGPCSNNFYCGTSKYGAASGESFTYACNAGWDNPSFFPLGPFDEQIDSSNDQGPRYLAEHWNTLWSVDSGNNNQAQADADGFWTVAKPNGNQTPCAATPPYPNAPTDTHIVINQVEDECQNLTGVNDALSTFTQSQQQNRPWYANDTWSQFDGWQTGGGGIGSDSISQFYAHTMPTPDGTRGLSLLSIDVYWMSEARADFGGGAGDFAFEECGDPGDNGGQPGMYGVTTGHSCTSSQLACGCRYGDTIDMIRANAVDNADGSSKQPIISLIEDGGPFAQNTTASTYITPPELNWAAWSSIIHGARGIDYFTHTFGGPACGGGSCPGGGSIDDTMNSYFQTVQSGNTISIDGQIADTDALILEMAPEINSPKAVGYVSATPASSLPCTSAPNPATGCLGGTSGAATGVETRAIYDTNSSDCNGQPSCFYIFSDTRDAEATGIATATFTTGSNTFSGSIPVVGENRNVTATSGVFRDSFAKGSTVHIYGPIPNEHT